MCHKLFSCSDSDTHSHPVACSCWLPLVPLPQSDLSQGTVLTSPFSLSSVFLICVGTDSVLYLFLVTTFHDNALLILSQWTLSHVTIFIAFTENLLDIFSSHYQPLRNSIPDKCLCMLYVQMYVCFKWETLKLFFNSNFYGHKLFIVFIFILIFIPWYPLPFPPITFFFLLSPLVATPLEKKIHAPLAVVNSRWLFRQEVGLMRISCIHGGNGGSPVYSYYSGFQEQWQIWMTAVHGPLTHPLSINFFLTSFLQCSLHLQVRACVRAFVCICVCVLCCLRLSTHLLLILIILNKYKSLN